MSIYLVDYENTKNLSGIQLLSENDTVIIFYSIKANTLSFDIHRQIMSSPARVVYKCVDVGGQNALDFQLSSYFGYIIKQYENTETEIFIVSKDQGFSHVCSFWKNEQATPITIIPDLANQEELQSVSAPQKIPAVNVNNDKNIKLKQLLKQSNIALNKNELEQTVEIVNKYKTPQALNNNLSKLLKDSSKVGAILKIVKASLRK